MDMPGKGDPKQGDKTFTQEEVNELMGKVRREVSGKYADYDDLKKKVAAYDDAQQEAKTEAQRMQEAIEVAQTEARKASDALARMQAERDHAQLVAKVADATGVPASLIHGADEEAMTASAKAIAEFAKASGATAPGDKGGSTVKEAATRESIYSIDDPDEFRAALDSNIDIFL